MKKTDIVKSHKKTQSILKFHVNGVNFKMIKVKGGTFTMGATSEQGDDVWGDDNSNNKTHPVGLKLPNELGIYDMSGNVLEWCSDWRGDYSAEAQTNPIGPLNGDERVLRGGFYQGLTEDCRVSCRSYTGPESYSGFYGFRLVLDL